MEARTKEGSISAILFAAGRGERLRPLTDAISKPALVVRGKPLGAYGLHFLREAGGRLAVNLWWLPEVTRAALEPYAPPGTLWFVETPAALGTAGTLRALLPSLSRTFAVMNADTITDLSLADLLTSHRGLGASATAAVRDVRQGADFVIDDDRAVRLVDRKWEAPRAGGLYVGAAVFDRDKIGPLLDDITVPAGLAEVVFKPLVARRDLAIHRHGGFAMDIGTPSALEEAREAVGELG